MGKSREDMKGLALWRTAHCGVKQKRNCTRSLGHIDDDSQKKSFMISVVDLLGEASETLV